MVASASQLRNARLSHQHLRGQVSEMILLSYSPQDDAEILPQFLQRMVDILHARCGAIWSLGNMNEIVCVCDTFDPKVVKASLHTFRPSQSILLEQALSTSGEALTKECAAVAGRIGAEKNTPVAIVVPIQRHGKPWGAIEIVLAEEITAKAQQDALTFVRHMARVLGQRVALRGESKSAAAPQPNRVAERVPKKRSVERSAKPVAPAAPTPKRTNVPAAAKVQQQYSAALLALHSSLGIEETAFVVVNEFRQLLRCDRVSVAVSHHGSYRLTAVSGQAELNRRADAVRHLEAIASLAGNESSPLWISRKTSIVPSHLSSALEEYSVVCDWHHLGIIPLRTAKPAGTDSAIAVAIVEQLQPLPPSIAPALLEHLVPHAAQAFLNAREQEQIFLLAFWKKLGKTKHWLLSTSRRKLAAFATGLIMITSFLAFFPVSFHVEGTGSLQPVMQRDVFAEVSGVVSVIHVEHGGEVKQGDVLLELRNTDLDVLIADVLGERRAAQEQLASIQRMRHVDHLTREEENRLTGQLLQVQEQLKGLDDQHRLLQKKKERLIVRSPMAGRVSTWNVQRQLMLRPVTPGQVLLTIADERGPWNLEVYLPESEAGHLLANQGEQAQQVEYLVTSQPTVTHSGEVTHIDDTAQLYDEYGHAVRVLVNIDRQDLPATPAGTSASARIQCGYKSAGYVWLHRLIDFVHSRILFPLF